jgi:hypothetical protein
VPALNDLSLVFAQHNLEHAASIFVQKYAPLQVRFEGDAFVTSVRTVIVNSRAVATEQADFQYIAGTILDTHLCGSS